MHRQVNCDLQTLIDWFDANQLSVNLSEKKTENVLTKYNDASFLDISQL